MRPMTASSEHDLIEAVLRPVRGHHAFEACVEQLATTIRLGVYPLGSTLPADWKRPENADGNLAQNALSRHPVRVAGHSFRLQ